MRRTLLHVVLPVVIGAVIYVLWRTPTLRVFHWGAALGLGDLISASRAFAARPSIRPPSAMLFNVPDGLWVYSLTAAMTLLWRHERPSLTKYAWIAAGLVIAIGAELGQAAHVVRGTFDVADVASYAVAAVLAVAATGGLRRSSVR